MKKILLSAMTVGLLILSSCIKSPLTTPFHVSQIGGGTWAFAGVIDTATSCVYSASYGNGAMSASNFSASFTTYTTIRMGFMDSLVTGTYTVVPTTVNPTSSQINFEIDYGIGGASGNSWYSTGTGSQTVNVVVSGNKVTVTGSGIHIYMPVNNPTASDTSTLTFNLYSPYN